MLYSHIHFGKAMKPERALPESHSYDQYCSFCESTPVVLIEYFNRKKTNDLAHQRTYRKRNIQHLKPPPNRPLCLLHFYTTDACRKVATNIESKELCTTATILDPSALKQQFPPQQELFAEAYLQIQQQIQDAMQQHQRVESDGSLGKNADDPLAIITDLNQGVFHTKHSPRRYDHRWKAAMENVKPQLQCPDGGFLRQIPIPERIAQVQQQQVQQQTELIARMNQSGGDSTDQESSFRHDADQKIAFPSSSVIPDLTQRRKPKRTNVWNILSADDRKQAVAVATLHEPTLDNHDDNHHVAPPLYDTSIACTCGNSTTVEVLSSNANKNQEMTKAETWGSKDRQDEIIHRYLCHVCGKSWNDVE